MEALVKRERDRMKSAEEAIPMLLRPVRTCLDEPFVLSRCAEKLYDDRGNVVSTTPVPMQVPTPAADMSQKPGL